MCNQTHPMKRPQNQEPTTVTRPEKIQKMNLQDFVPLVTKYELNSPESLFLSEIQEQIYADTDQSIMANLLWKPNAPELDQNDRNKLHADIEALEKSLTKMPSEIFHNNLIAKKNLLYAFTLFPKLAFPQAFFTAVPYMRIKDKRPYLHKIIEAFVNNEQEGILVCCFHVTLRSLGEALIAQKEKGISIEVVTNQSQGSKKEDSRIIEQLEAKNIPILSPKNKKYEQMHHKFFIFKRNLLNKAILVTGSYNPTPHGDINSWDDLIIVDDPTVIDAYTKRFEEVKQRSQ
jgi:phosphatidylserine/phosphatidylglycerophosphate/cardiolipin synthase-like enzyme